MAEAVEIYNYLSNSTQSKVAQFRFKVLVEKNIGRFYVTMNDGIITAGMQKQQTTS